MGGATVACTMSNLVSCVHELGLLGKAIEQLTQQYQVSDGKCYAVHRGGLYICGLCELGGLGPRARQGQREGEVKA
jgi:hypothetical protein